MLAVANIFFFVAHTSLIVFNLLGWIPRKTRKLNLITLSLTVSSWTLMGVWNGMGYCVCTDWHWQIRRAMGIEETADSYLVLMVRNVWGWDPPIGLVNAVAAAVLVSSVACSVWVNIQDWRRARAPQVV